MLVSGDTLLLGVTIRRPGIGLFSNSGVCVGWGGSVLRILCPVNFFNFKK